MLMAYDLKPSFCGGKTIMPDPAKITLNNAKTAQTMCVIRIRPLKRRILKFVKKIS